MESDVLVEISEPADRLGRWRTMVLMTVPMDGAADNSLANNVCISNGSGGPNPFEVSIGMSAKLKSVLH